jgi:hypothetical protein
MMIEGKEKMVNIYKDINCTMYGFELGKRYNRRKKYLKRTQARWNWQRPVLREKRLGERKGRGGGNH